jgi:hypothetical protein
LWDRNVIRYGHGGELAPDNDFGRHLLLHVCGIKGRASLYTLLRESSLGGVLVGSRRGDLRVDRCESTGGTGGATPTELYLRAWARHNGVGLEENINIYYYQISK